MNKKQNFRSTASFGKRQEHTVTARLLKENMDVYMALTDEDVDCIIKKNAKTYYDIQIKARSKDCLPVDAARFSSMAIRPRSNYYFIFYSEQVDRFWVVSSGKLVNLASKNKKGKHAGKYQISFTGVKQGRTYPLERFKAYEDAFHLLK